MTLIWKKSQRCFQVHTNEIRFDFTPIFPIHRHFSVFVLNSLTYLSHCRDMSANSLSNWSVLNQPKATYWYLICFCICRELSPLLMVHFALDIKCGTQCYLDLFKRTILYCIALHCVALHNCNCSCIALCCIHYIKTWTIPGMPVSYMYRLRMSLSFKSPVRWFDLHIQNKLSNIAL